MTTDSKDRSVPGAEMAELYLRSAITSAVENMETGIRQCGAHEKNDALSDHARGYFKEQGRELRAAILLLRKIDPSTALLAERRKP